MPSAMVAGSFDPLRARLALSLALSSHTFSSLSSSLSTVISSDIAARSSAGRLAREKALLGPRKTTGKRNMVMSLGDHQQNMFTDTCVTQICVPQDFLNLALRARPRTNISVVLQFGRLLGAKL